MDFNTGLERGPANHQPLTPLLFLERAAASGAHLDISDVDALVVASICRKLDGVPIAIAVESVARSRHRPGPSELCRRVRSR